ncbi:hypothetical protein [Massilia sp. CFBP9026]|uniref:hypothetical protein n=1 Tax=Massilia sp. CFBP9026 TaxID=3096536 RepID=UPI002A6AB8FC|nr:hypothetical protein [Massilia sp. CFBP9026]MDY0965577.1 hypothetical protein [Massilia sp. CFBP9026]
MRNKVTPTIFAVGMIAGSLPCTLAILTFVNLMAAREAGQPASGDALGLMMMSLIAYGIAVLSCAVGLIYFAHAALKASFAVRAWHWFGIAFSLVHVLIPLVYFYT